MAPEDLAKQFKCLKLFKQAKIVAWSEAGLSLRAIAVWIGWENATINRIINKLKLLNDNIAARKPGSGRSRQAAHDEEADNKISFHDAADLKETVP